jgi:hypothetical protein
MVLPQISRRSVYGSESSSKLHKSTFFYNYHGWIPFQLSFLEKHVRIDLFDYSFESTTYDRGPTYSYSIDIGLGHIYKRPSDPPKTISAPNVDQN